MVIALGLTSILMAVLSYFYWELSTIDSRTDKAVHSLYELAYVESRLATVLPQAISENSPKSDFFFFTTNTDSSGLVKGTSLFFTYDNGVDLDKQLSNHVLGRLFVDSKDRLVLATWPSPTRWKEGSMPPMKRETLLENVSEIGFDFFVAPAIDRGEVIQPTNQAKARQIANAQPPGGWTKEWKTEYYQLPPLVKLTLKWSDPQQKTGAKERPLTFSFPLPNSTQVIFYNK
jgi:hypothetical protein